MLNFSQSRWQEMAPTNSIVNTHQICLSCCTLHHYLLLNEHAGLAEIAGTKGQLFQRVGVDAALALDRGSLAERADRIPGDLKP